MQSAFETAYANARPRGMRTRPLIFSFLILALLFMSVGCRYLRATTPALAPTASAIPRQDPLPTIEVLDSEALYGQDSRSIGQTSPNLASFPAGAILPPAPAGQSERAVSIILDADTTLSGELYSAAGPRQPGMLILGSELTGWGGLPSTLAENGFAVLVIQTDPLTPARWVEAMLQSFIAAPGVDASAIGVIGADRAADIAALGCAVNSLCDALALLSPRSRDTLVNMMPSYGARPIWLAAGRDDVEAFSAASALAEAAAGDAELFESSAGRGPTLLQLDPNLVDELVSWLRRQLQGRQSQLSDVGQDGN